MRSFSQGLRVMLLIMDDWGMEKITTSQRYDLMEIMEDRYGERSTVIVSQRPVSEWHGVIRDNTVADAVLDRIIHNSHRLELRGESMRKAAARGQAGEENGGDSRDVTCS